MHLQMCGMKVPMKWRSIALKDLMSCVGEGNSEHLTTFCKWMEDLPDVQLDCFLRRRSATIS